TALIRGLDSAATRAGKQIAALWITGNRPRTILGSAGDQIQVVNSLNEVLSNSPDADHTISLVSTDQLVQARSGHQITLRGDPAITDDRLRIVGVPAGDDTVLVASDLGGVESSTRILRTAALIGCPI